MQIQRAATVMLCIAGATLLLLMALAGLISPAVLAQDPKPLPPAPVELVGLRTEYSKTYDLGGGLRSLETSSYPIHYRNNPTDSREEWKEIDLTFVDGTITTAPYDVFVIEDDNDPGIHVWVRDKYDAEGYNITVGTAVEKQAEPILLGEKGGEIGDLGGGSITPVPIQPKTPKPVFDGSTVTWLNVFTDVDVVLEVYPWGIDLYRVIKSDSAPVEYNVKIVEPSVDAHAELLPLQPAVDALGQLIEMVEEETEEGRTEIIGDTVISPDPQPIAYPIKDSVVVSVGQSSDDCQKWWNGTAWNFGFTTTANGAGDPTGANSKYGCGMRFQNITVPKGSVISSSSKIEFCANANQTGSNCNTLLYAEAADNASTYVGLVSFNARVLTTSYVAWSYIGSWTLDTWYSLSNINSPIQEVIDRPGWSSGNAIALQWHDFGGSSTDGAFRGAWSYDSAPAKAPKLTIEYSVTSITDCSPGSLNQGDEDEDVVLTGDLFTTATDVDFGEGITVNSFIVNTDEQITVNVDVDSDAELGMRDVSVTAVETATLTDGFEVTGNAPTITSINPSQGNQGDVFNIVADGTEFVEDMDPDLFWAATDAQPASSLVDTFPVKYFDSPYEDWNYCMDMIVTNSSGGALSDYQVRVDISDAGFNYDHIGRVDGGDLRFVEEGATPEERPYWIEEWDDGGDSIVWVNLESVPVGDETISVYYGNSGAIDGSDGPSTFAWFDGFDGSSLDLGEWQGDTGYASVGGGVLTYTCDDTATRSIYTYDDFGQGYAFRSRANMQDADEYEEASTLGLSLADETDLAKFLEIYISFPLNISAYIYVRDEGAQTGFVSQVPWVYGSYATWSILRNGATDVSFLVNDVETLDSPIVTNIPDEDLPVYFSDRDTTLLVDWVLVRKYVDTEPTNAFGVEWGPSDRSYRDYFDSMGGCSSYDDVGTTDGVLTPDLYYSGSPFNDGFESSLAKWDQHVATNWLRASGYPWTAYNGSYYAYSYTYLEGWFVSDSINLSSYNEATISFWVIEDDLEADDALLYFYEKDVGYHLIQFVEYMSSVDDTWTQFTFTIDMDLYRNDDFRIAFWTDFESGEAMGVDYLFVYGYKVESDGYAYSQEVPLDSGFKNAQAIEMWFDGDSPAGTTTTIQLYFYYETAWILVSDTTLPGNAAGFPIASSPVDISSVGRTYGRLRIKISFTSTGASRPYLDDWGVSLYARVFEDPDPIIGVPGEEESIMVNGWQWRKPITIDNSGAERTDYHVMVTMNTESLIDAFKLREDCGDLRIYDSDDDTVLNFWIDEGLDSASTEVWVYIPVIPAASEKTIYMRYGNSSITVNSFNVTSSTQVIINVTIGEEAPPGDRDLSIVTPGGQGVCAGCFTVVAVATGGGEIEMTSLFLLALLVLAGLLSFFAWRARFIVVSMAAGIVWLALAVLALVDPDTIGFESISTGWVVMLSMVFLLMAFAMLLLQMRTDIRHEATVHGRKMSWTTSGSPPSNDQIKNTNARQLEYRNRIRKMKGKGR